MIFAPTNRCRQPPQTLISVEPFRMRHVRKRRGTYEEAMSYNAGGSPGVIDAEAITRRRRHLTPDIETKHAGYHTAEVLVALRCFVESLVCMNRLRW